MYEQRVYRRAATRALDQRRRNALGFLRCYPKLRVG
jgi:hypothetical protein